MHAAQEYAALEIRLDRQGEGWQVELRFINPLSEAELPAVRGAAHFDHKLLLRLHLDPRAYGEALSAALFHDEVVRTFYGQVKSAVETAGMNLRLRLLVGPAAPELQALRWELLCAPESSPGAPQPLLATSEKTLFSRFMVSHDWRPVQLRPKSDLKALVAVAAPWDLKEYKLAEVDLEGEIGRACTSLEGIAVAVLGKNEPLTLAHLIGGLRCDVDILYLVCHGSAAAQGRESLLILQDEDGAAAWVTGHDLAERVAELAEPPRLVVLASCDSVGMEDGTGTSSKELAQASVAPRLAEAGVSAVLAMQGKISMKTIEQAMPVFFKELLIDGQIDRALAVARGSVCERSDSWMPALFLRLKGGRIWYEPRTANETKPFDAFLSHNSADEPLVNEIGRWLEAEAGLQVWLDDRSLISGDSWKERLERALDGSRCCVVFLGKSGIGGWQNKEMRAALAERATFADLRIVPVLLPGASRPRRESELPPFLRRLTWVKFGKNCHDEKALHRLLCGIRGIPPGRREAGATDDGQICPYRGLEVFRPEDRRFFFGREALVERLLDYLNRHRFLTVVGPSGSGKSSVVQAGMVPGLDDSENLIQILAPRERPLEELAIALRRCFPEGQAPPTEELMDRLGRADEALHLIARELTDITEARRLVLVVDQFEELFTQVSDHEERQCFVRNLLGAVEISGPTSVILTMRSDFLGHCADDPNLNIFIEEHLVQVGPMSREEQKSAIFEPARLVGLVFEDGLVEVILDDVKDSPSELPLLQHALLELYNLRDGARLTLETYQRIGRVDGALTRRADHEFEKVGEVEQETLQKMFTLCLVKVGEGTEDTRRRAAREELLAVGEDPRIAESLLEQWTDARLLTTQSDETHRHQLVDVAHEALIRKWGKLAMWMAEGRERMRLVHILRQGAKEWQRKKRHPDYLFRGARLAQAKELLISYGSDLTEVERSFVAAAKSRALRTLRLITASVVFALAIAGYLVYDSTQSRNAAERRLARNYWKASQAARSEGRLLLSLHFSAEAIAINPAFLESQLIDMEQIQPQFALSKVIDSVWHAVFSGDRTRVLTWSANHIVRVWDAATGEPVGPPLEHDGWVQRAILNSDGSLVLTSGFDAASKITAQLWNGTTGERSGLTLKYKHLGWWFTDAVINGDGSRVLTWENNTARLWDGTTGEQIGRVLEHQGRIDSAWFNGDQSRILTKSENTARVWNAVTSEPVGPMFEHQGLVNGIRFNRDESRALTWSRDHTARLWDAANGEQIGPVFEHQDSVYGAIFNRDETRILTWSEDHTARLWDAATGERIGPAFEHQDSIYGATFNRDETRVLTRSEDHTARLWDATNGEPVGPAFKHQGSPVHGARFNRDESRILTWSGDNTARLWDTTGEQIGPALYQDSIISARFNNDESRVLTRNFFRARLWDLAIGETDEIVLEHQDSVNGALLNHDQSRVLTWSEDRTARLWDATNGEMVGSALEHQGSVLGAFFNRDETRILTWSEDRTARLWDAATGKQVGSILEHQGPVNGARFNGEQNRILTWSGDHTARLWSATTGEQIGSTLQHQGPVNGAQFNHDESQILTWSEDHTVRLWEATTGEQIGSVLRHKKPVKGALFNGDESRVLIWDDISPGQWDLSTGKEIKFAFEHFNVAQGALFNRDHRHILTWGHQGALLWDATTGERIGPGFEHQDQINGALFDGDESRVLTWSKDNSARLWDAATGKATGPALEHQGTVLGALFNRDESRVLTWSEDNAARLWDAATGEPIGPTFKHQGPVGGALFNRDESRVLTWSEDNTARLWDTGADLDFPGDSVLLQVRALTGIELVPLTREIRSIGPERWRQIESTWDKVGRSHYKICRYPKYNLWRRFHIEEAEKIRPLK